MKKNQKNFLLCLINIQHTAVKRLTVNEKEDNKTRITTRYFNISGARHSFELWLFYFNFIRRSKGIFKNTLDFIDTKANIEDLNIPANLTVGFLCYLNFILIIYFFNFYIAIFLFGNF